MQISLNKFEEWLRNKNLQDITIEKYLYYFTKFLKHGSFTQENVSKFLSHKGNRGVARAFLLNYKKFLTVNYKELGLTKDFRLEVSEVELPSLTGSVKRTLIKPLTQEQILHLEKYLPGEKEKIKLLMTYYGGLRNGELHKIKISSFNWELWKKDTDQLGECLVHGKGNKEGLSLFPPSVMKRAARYIRSQNYLSLASYLFLKDSEDIHGTILINECRTWQRKLKAAAISAGITKLDSTGKVIKETDVHPHTLRHSWGFHLKNIKEMDIRDIQEVLRHSSITSTQLYTYTDKSRLKDLLKE